MAISYKDSGVDVERGYKAVELMKKHVQTTFNENVLGDIGSFGGFYSIAGERWRSPCSSRAQTASARSSNTPFSRTSTTPSASMRSPCASTTSSVRARSRCFSLIISLRANSLPKSSPRSFRAWRKAAVRRAARSSAARLRRCPVLSDGEYDIAGFAVGIVDKKKIINGKSIAAGDTLIGIASSGIHSNGYSLVRRLFGDSDNAHDLDRYDDRLKDKVLNVLLTPTKIYVKTILSLIRKVSVKGIAHITGGGFIENIPRIFLEGIGCEIDTKSYPVPAIFDILREKSQADDAQLYNTFNMGIGMVVCVDSADAEKTLAALLEEGEKAYVIGRTVKGKGVTLR